MHRELFQKILYEDYGECFIVLSGFVGLKIFGSHLLMEKNYLLPSKFCPFSLLKCKQKKPQVLFFTLDFYFQIKISSDRAKTMYEVSLGV